MPKTVQIRNIDDETYSVLAQRAAEGGVSVPELLRAEAERIASRPSIGEWLERTRRRPSQIEPNDVLAGLNSIRGDWPDADS
ncbi:MAG: hypothetical protein GEU79_16890 [Acidimicrobiia bacterium]|nr:hypothetical protein [Acidimicrobiia bacterium]